MKLLGRIGWAASLGCALLALASCQKKEPKTRDILQKVHLNLKSEPATLDPRKGGDVISSHMHFLLFEGLVRLLQDGSIVPAQARTFLVSPDGLTYTFLMRGGLWSDGSRVTSYDFEKAWKNILDPNFPSVNAHLLYPIKNAEAAKKGKLPLESVGLTCPDENTFVVTLEKPTPYFLDLIAFCVFFPVHSQIDKDHPDWAFDAGEHFVSNGPFLLKEWKHNNEILAVKNPLYWDTNRVRPSEIHFSMVDNETTALQMFENKQLDLIGEPLSPIPVEALPELMRKGRVYTHPLGATTMITFNVNAAPFDNKKIRKAFSYAIDRTSIVNNISQTGEIPATCAIPPILKNNINRSFFKDGDAECARKLFEEGLKECGYTREDFKHVTYHYSSANLNHKIAQAVQQQWETTLGVRIKLEQLDAKILMDKLVKRDYQIALSLWVAQYSDAMNILERFKFRANAKNYASWENPQYISLLDQSFYENGLQRLATLEKAEEIFMEEMPICPIYHWNMPYMIQPHLKHVALTPIGDLVFENLAVDERRRL